MTTIDAQATPITTPQPGSHPSHPLPPRPFPRSHPTKSGETGPIEWERIAGHRLEIVRYMRSRCRDLHQAEDMAHDALLRAAFATSGRVRSVRGWLLSIAANLHRDTYRREAFEVLTPDDSAVFELRPGREPVPGDEPEGSLLYVRERVYESREVALELDSMWGILSQRDRAILTAYYLHGKSMVEAAAQVGSRPELAKVWLYRARRRLAGHLRRRLGRIPDAGGDRGSIACGGAQDGGPPA